VVFKIHEVTGEKVSTTTIWKLRNGQLTNPQLRVIQALARTFGVPGGFFLEDYDEGKLGLQQEQVELLALIRNSGMTAAEFKTLLKLDDEGREVIAGLIRRPIGPAGQAPGSDPGGTPRTDD
jgi:transcriptional regulator with XRE-family HTH domain